ncbi:TMV resistance protein N isoform X1 [Helianthus annuus]|nr:TMV resistance protein N isoform X1 [Helianthus annuus]XP_035833178.1 TMV resistance protein N isoform X1 [Helianthus annuus]XP_035833179.1 TMV resistance protein N isoform X1 [Helianthus annuus]XP_035833180.1 TMV resistance protein N isoform X1 [Helianthus annuus]
MASTSASSIEKSFKYDVFLSFRGEDTRKTFIDHLYLALHHRGIITYKDDEKIEKGKGIDDQLIRSIEDSKFHLIVFSKNYASSSWCLDELVKIMECQRTTELQTAYPIFYDVEPTEVRNQSGVVGEAFAKHENKEAAGRWRDALKEAAGLAGWELNKTLDGHEAKFIQKIIEKISPKLYFISLRSDENLVGMETRVKDVVSSLEINSNDVSMIGIKGMGGAGKTTLARAVFDHISVWFEGKSFVENVREGSKGSGLKELQKQVLQNVLNDKNLDVESVYDGKIMMRKIMPGRKVLVVLDDVDHIDQLKALAGSPKWFKPGSKIIITTRDEQVLRAHGVNFIHDVSLLSHEEAICLFNRCAFVREIPVQEYEELSRKVVHYAAGLPLTITVLGSFLCGRAAHEWEDALERLKTIPEDQTLQRLELSYSGLENDHKEIFLDVACLLRGETKDEAARVLKSCGFNAEIGLSVLEQRSLITISDTDCLCLHDLIEEMGWNIVRRLHPDEPNKHSRLWIKEEIEDILVNQSGTKATRCIKLQFTNLHPTIIMEGLRNMKELRFLSVENDNIECEVDEVGQYLPNTLRCLHWLRYPFWCLPETFQANKLVKLKMIESNICELWEGEKRKVLNKLRFLELTDSNFRTFDLGMAPNLEILYLKGCNDFVELYIPAECPKLKSLNVGGSKLRTFDLGMTPNLEALDLVECIEFQQLHTPTECPKLQSLNLGCSKLRNVNLEYFYLTKCSKFLQLHMPECPNLKASTSVV